MPACETRERGDDVDIEAGLAVDECKQNDQQEPAVASAAPTLRPDFPEGGLRAWLVVVGVSCCFFAGFGQVKHLSYTPKDVLASARDVRVNR